MNGREQIGSWSLTTLLIGFLLGTNIVLPMGIQAMRDAWLAVLLGGCFGLLAAWLAFALTARFPGQSLISCSKTILGRWLGGFVGLLYIWYCFHLGALTLHYVSDFIITTLLPATPIRIPVVIFAVLCAYAVRQGLEPLARSSQVLTLVVVLALPVIALLVLNHVRLENLTPVLEYGPGPVLRAAVSVAGMPFGEVFLFTQILPRTWPANTVRPAVLTAMLLTIGLLGFIHTQSTAVLGVLVRTARFPLLEVVRMIDISEYLSRIDALIVVAWVSTGFLKTAVCLYAAVAGLAEWLGCRDYRELIAAVTVLMAEFALVVMANVSEMYQFAAAVWPLYSAPFHFLIPLLLLGTAALRGVGAGRKA